MSTRRLLIKSRLDEEAGRGPQYPDTVSWWCVVNTPYDVFEGTLAPVTPDGERATVIVTRQGQGSGGECGSRSLGLG